MSSANPLLDSLFLASQSQVVEETYKGGTESERHLGFESKPSHLQLAFLCDGLESESDALIFLISYPRGVKNVCVWAGVSLKDFRKGLQWHHGGR